MATTRAFGTIRMLPSGRYQARYWHLGRQVSAGSTFATKADARAWLASVETDLNRGEHFDPSGGRVPFGEHAEEWLGARGLRPRTRETYRSQLTHILPKFGRASIGEITPVDVRRWHGSLLESGLKSNTTAKVHRLFRTIMSTAVDDGLLRSNAVFGSFARSASTATSDIDFLVDFEPTSSLLDLVHREDALQDQLGVEVDVVSTGALLDRDDAIRRDAVPL